MPSPRQVLHFSFGILPLPLQCRHGWTMVTAPKKELVVSCTLPCPLQWVQVINSLPFAAPEPLQVSQRPVLARSTVRLTPKTESRKEISKSMEMSRPLDLPLVPPPAKKSLKISPMSKPPWLKASWNWEKSNPAPPNPVADPEAPE